ncbi:MAG: S-layer homology domain-containing protein, partial [bacterium]|nr:S-layer homology domain-containing protein [bacterium]
ETGIADHKASAMWVRITDNNSGKFGDYYYYHLNDTSITPKPEITIGEYTTDATSVLIEEDETGKVVSVFIYDGTYVKSSTYVDEYLFKSTQPKTLGYKLNGSNMVEISTDKVINDPDNTRTAFATEDLKDLTIYVGTNSRGAVYNLNIVSGTSKSGGYLYFGDTPIVSGSETDTSADSSNDNNPNNNIGDNHGGGSGAISGGGGGGGASKPSTDDKNDEDQITEPVDPINPIDPVDPVPSTPSYDDVDKTDWFYDYVNELTEKGIVSGDGSGGFEPQNNVTREQFLKMLLIAAEVDSEEAENTFDDVSDDDWFKSYVLMAKGLGIVNGISESSFGIGSNITRQDMAVMISRIIENLGIQISGAEAEDFADVDKVSDYAKQSVAFMKSIGLIEGYNNEFRPLDNLTRAESSKVISQLLGLIP